MEWLLDNLEWLVGSIITILGLIFGVSFIIKKNVQNLVRILQMFRLEKLIMIKESKMEQNLEENLLIFKLKSLM